MRGPTTGASRERREDIPALVHHFINRKAREMGIPGRPSLSPRSVEKLMPYHWPGNVRELQNVVERALILYRGGELSFEVESNSPAARSLELADLATEDIGDDPVSLEEITARHIRRVLKVTGGKVEGPWRAARRLGLHPSSLRNKMRKLKIPFGRGAVF